MKKQRLYPGVVILFHLTMATHTALSQSPLDLPTPESRAGYLPGELRGDPSQTRHRPPVSRTPRPVGKGRFDPSRDRWTSNPFDRNLRATPSPSRYLKRNSDSVRIAWERQFGSQQVPGRDNGTAVATDVFGNVYVTGSGWAALHVVKLRQGAEDLRSHDTFSLLQNYPNPFNSTRTVRYFLARPANVTLKIFDILGREVETLISADHDAGVHEITWGNEKLSNGVYFFRLVAGSLPRRKEWCSCDSIRCVLSEKPSLC